jgi:hypothetical protein
MSDWGRPFVSIEGVSYLSRNYCAVGCDVKVRYCANWDQLGWGVTNESIKICFNCTHRGNRGGRGAPGSPVRGSLSAGTPGDAIDWQNRIFGPDTEYFGERRVVFAGPRAGCGSGHPIFAADARACPGTPKGCAGSVHGTCGTLLVKPTSVPRCIHD